MVYSLEEFHSLLEKRNVKYFLYYEYSFYRYVPDGFELLGEAENFTFDNESSLINLILKIIQQVLATFSFVKIGKNIFSLLFVSPIIFFIFKLLVGQIKTNKDNTLKRFVFLCMIMLFIFTIMFGFFVSTDYIRWLGHSYLALMSMIIYISYKEPQFLRLITKGIESISKFMIIIYVLLYAITIYHPYSTL